MVTDGNDKLIINDKSHKVFFKCSVSSDLWGNIVELYIKYISFFKERNYQRDFKRLGEKDKNDIIIKLYT